ncbi:MAG TPA: neutral zinc metallopeptidase [Gemmatimonadales bacterium]|nr:neutral zinc metallopeptidase [Gemmatimonadales bacterium]
MRWSPRGRSSNLDDLRAQTGGRRGLRVGGGLGLGGIVLLLVIGLLTGQNPLALLGALIEGGAGGPGAETGAPPSADELAAEEETVQFVSFVLDDVQNTWRQLFPRLGEQYVDARLALFRDAVESACGLGQAAMGPFYCPGDRRVYIDLGFYDDLRRRFGAPGDFAEAYVIAHEIGHHVQNLLGIERDVRREQQANPGAANELSVRMELQADCFAGIWGHSTAQRDILERGDVEEGLNAAAAIGDDRIQSMGGGRVAPESFTHGSSEQRVRWFRRGLEEGRVEACNAFSGRL